MRIERLTTSDRARARETFLLMADVFDEDATPLGDAYLDRLLARDAFWALAAVDDAGTVVGGLTAHTLPMTTAEASALFIYDLAVRPDWQRRGVGRQLVAALREQAAAEGIDDVFVPAENEDVHAIAFYRALGGEPTAMTMFDFADDAS